MENIKSFAASRETDIRIVSAIFWLAGDDEAAAKRIWDRPTESEIVAIWEIATKNGLLDANEMSWGVDTLAAIATGIVG